MKNEDHSPIVTLVCAGECYSYWVSECSMEARTRIALALWACIIKGKVATA
jgi:hypothetical protein